MMMMVVVVMMMKAMIMKIGLSATKMTMIFVIYHFMHLVINHIETNKCQVLCRFLVQLCLKK
jgi:hypothetical protein